MRKIKTLKKYTCRKKFVAGQNLEQYITVAYLHFIFHYQTSWLERTLNGLVSCKNLWKLQRKLFKCHVVLMISLQTWNTWYLLMQTCDLTWTCHKELETWLNNDTLSTLEVISHVFQSCVSCLPSWYFERVQTWLGLSPPKGLETAMLLRKVPQRLFFFWQMSLKEHLSRSKLSVNVSKM